MDQAIIGSIFTVIVFIAFVGVLYWAFTSRNKARFDEAANIIFEDDDNQQPNDKQES